MTHINRETVERRQARIREEYEGVHVVEERWESPPDEFERYVEGSDDGHVGAREGYVGGGYCWVVRTPDQNAPLTETMPEAAGEDEDRVLLILGRDDSGWGVAGGGVEDSETYEEAAVREVREETGVTCEVTDCYRLERVRRVSTDPDDDRTVHLLYAFFDAAYVDGEISVQPGELHGACWFALAPGRVHPASERKAEAWFAPNPSHE